MLLNIQSGFKGEFPGVFKSGFRSIVSEIIYCGLFFPHRLKEQDCLKSRNMNLVLALLAAVASPALGALELVPGATWTAVSF